MDFNTTLTVGSLIVTIISIVVSVFALSEKIQFSFLKFFGGRLLTPRIKGVAGIWISSYTYLSAGQIKRDYHLFEIRQFKRRFVGTSLTDCFGHYHVEGIVDHDLFVTGIWESRILRDKHTGSFQLISDYYGKELKGKWIGFNKDGKVQHGPIQWVFYSNAIGRSQKKKLIENVRKKRLDNYLKENNLYFEATDDYNK